MRRAAWGIAVAYAIGGCFIVFSPISGQLDRLTIRLHTAWVSNLHLPGSPAPTTFGAVLNVILFVPLGVLVVLLVRWPWWRATLLAMAVSAGIELVQVVPMLDRTTSLGDVVTNTAGGLLGALAGAWVRTPWFGDAPGVAGDGESVG